MKKKADAFALGAIFMTLASDQDHDPRSLSTTSQRMLELRDEVFAEWEQRVRSLVQETSGLPRPILINTLPSFYDNIAQAITKDSARTTAVDGSTLAGEHGGERARLTKFDPQALVSEYQIFRWTIFDVLHRREVALTHADTLTINASIDSGIREAVNTFALVHAGFREQFIAALTHDLRGPLSAISSTLDLIMISTEPARMKSLAVRAMDNVSRMDGMIHSLLDSMANQTSERMQLKLTHFDIADVVREVQVQAAATHDMRFQIFGGSVRGWWDRDALRRAVENLVGNAVKYGDTSHPIRISFTEAYERLILMVHNYGVPIAHQDQEDVFQMFRRAQAATDGKAKGWGIGLPYVRSVAESHGGSIVLDSAVDRGTTFTLDIPIDSRSFQDAAAFGQAT